MVLKTALLLAVAALGLSNAEVYPTYEKYNDRKVNCRRVTSRPPALTTGQQVSRGPQAGSLVIAGGSLPQGSAVFTSFLSEAGGNNARIVYVPTNRGSGLNTPAQLEAELADFVRVSGFGNLSNPVEVLHTWNRSEADDASFYGTIDRADGVWFRGGLPQWSYDSYFGTETQNALERLLLRGGVIGGTSAGALMQSNIMCRADRTRGNQVVYGDPNQGFAFGSMQNIVVDVHNIARNRAHDLLEVLDLFPDMLGINVDEGTAAVFRGDVFEVVGTGYVQMFDSTLWQDETDQPICADFRLSTGLGRTLIPNMGKSHFLLASRGDKYNVRTRQTVATTLMTAAEMSVEV